MNVFQVLLNLNDFSDQHTIYAVEPWSLDSEAQVVIEPAEGLIQIQQQSQFFEYFIEIATAKMLLQQLESQNLCTQVQYQRIIDYVMDNA